jgi:hypothetical protein
MTEYQHVWTRRRFVVTGVTSLAAGALAGCVPFLHTRKKARQVNEPASSPRSDGRLEMLLDRLIPAGGEFPSASAAGVPIYIAKLLTSVPPSVGEWRREQYEQLLRELNTLGFFTPDATAEARDRILADIERRPDAKDPARVALKLVREDTINGYFADPVIWRENHGASVWTVLRVDPIYPCDNRTEVRARRMRAEPRSRLVRHLVEPPDRLSEAVRATPAAELVERYYSRRSPVY